jgi:hypothetical protein
MFAMEVLYKKPVLLASTQNPQIDELNLLQEKPPGKNSIPPDEKTFKTPNNSLFLKDLSTKQQGNEFNH